MFELQVYENKKWIKIEHGNDCSFLIIEAFKRYNYGSFRVVSPSRIEYSFKINKTF